MKKKVKTIDQIEHSEFIKNLYLITKRTTTFSPNFYIPTEDPSGCFHEFSKNILKVRNGNYQTRKKLGEILLSKDFKRKLYTNVGKYLGFKEKDIFKKNIKNKISSAVISSTFPSKFTKNLRFDDDTALGNSKYLEINENFFYHIFPSEKKEVFSNYYIKDNRLFIHDACTDLSSTKNTKSKLFCNLEKTKLMSSNGSTRGGSFYQTPPLPFNSSIKENIGYVLNSKEVCIHNKLFPLSKWHYGDIKNDPKVNLVIDNSSIGKSSFEIKICSDSFPLKASLLAFKSISRPITSKDLLLDAEWYKLNENEIKRKIHKDNYFISQMNENKDIWGFKFKNTALNRKKLHQHFVKNNFTKDHWQNENYHASSVSDFLVNGDLIIDIGSLFRNIVFPLGIQKYSSRITFPQSIGDVVHNCISEEVKKLNLEYHINYKKEYLKLFSVIKKYNKPVDLNESITFMKGFVGTITDELTKETRNMSRGRNVHDFVEKFLSRRRGHLYPDFLPRERLAPVEDYLKICSLSELHNSIWRSMKIIPNDEPIHRIGSRSQNEENHEAREENITREHHVNYYLDNIENILEKKNTRWFGKARQWLKDEELIFCQSYYKNFEKHPAASSRKHKRILQKYNRMDGKEIIRRFRNFYDQFTQDSKSGEESPEKKIKKLNKKLSYELNKLSKEIKKTSPKAYFSDYKVNLANLNSPLRLSQCFGGVEGSPGLFLKKLVKIQKTIKTPSKNNILIKYTTKSFEKDGKRLKSIMENFIHAEKNKSTKRINTLIGVMRKWLAEEETNYINITSSGNFDKDNEAEGWFFYPNYKSSSLSKIFQLEKMNNNAWDHELVDTIKQIMNLIKTDHSLARDFEIGIKRRASKAKIWVDWIWMDIYRYVAIQENINLDKSFYGLGDSMVRILSFIDGVNPYSNEGWDGDLDSTGQQKSGTMLGGVSDDNLAILLYKEYIDTAIKKDIRAIIVFYEKILDKMIKEFETKQTQLFKIMLTTPSSLTPIISTWEALNHFKAINRYINLICDYDLFEISKIRDADKELNNLYISKNDANFLIRKSNKYSNRNISDELKKYLHKNKSPNFQNDDKYRELRKLIRKTSYIKIYKKRGENCIEKSGFISWLRQRIGYRRLKEFRFTENDIKHTELSIFVAIDSKKKNNIRI